MAGCQFIEEVIDTFIINWLRNFLAVQICIQFYYIEQAKCEYDFFQSIIQMIIKANI